MKFCKFCGYAEEDNNANFCAKCGKPLNNIVEDKNLNTIKNEVKIEHNSDIHIDKSKSLDENYQIIIENYITNNPILSTRIIKGNPYIIGNTKVEEAVYWHGRNMNPKKILLFIDDSIYDSGICGILFSSSYINSWLVPFNNIDSLKISELFSIETKNKVINLNKGRARLDLIMLNNEEFNFLYNLMNTLISFNISDNISKILNDKEGFKYDNKRLNMSIPEKIYYEMINRFTGSGQIDDRIITHPHTHKDKADNAIKNICKEGDVSEIFLILDDTILNSAKAGIVFTKNNIYIKPAFSSQYAIIPWFNLENISVDRKTLIINGETYKFNLDQPVMAIGGLIKRVIEAQNGNTLTHID